MIMSGKGKQWALFNGDCDFVPSMLTGMSIIWPNIDSEQLDSLIVNSGEAELLMWTLTL
jgi:hypothetical protein